MIEHRRKYLAVGLLAAGLGLFSGSRATAEDAPVAVRPARQRPHAARLTMRPAKILSSIGFELTQGGSRLVLRIAEANGVLAGVPPLTQHGLIFEVPLDGVRTKHASDLLPLETRFFPTPLKRAQLFRTKTGLVLRGELDNGSAALQSSTEGGVTTLTIQLLGTAPTQAEPAQSAATQASPSF